jgi:hypothetical protein
LVIQENNKLFKRPLVYSDGQILEQDIVVPPNMDRTYLKFETTNEAIVRPIHLRLTTIL